MASQNFVPWFLAGLRLATPIVVLAAALTACHKEPPHRAKRVRQHPAASAAAPGPDDDSPPVPPVPAASPPVAAASPAPPPPAPPPPLPPPPSRHQLTVDRSDRNPPSRPLPAAAPGAPEPAAAEYQAVTDKPPPAAAAAPSSRCEGGSKGERLAVQGVAADDVLNVRDAPDKAGAVLGALPHDATGIHGTANRRRVGASTWREVECGKLRGWVNQRFLAREAGQ